MPSKQKLFLQGTIIFFKKEKTTQQNTNLSNKKYICLHQEWEPRVGRQT